jgi:hypothetical protein
MPPIYRARENLCGKTCKTWADTKMAHAVSTISPTGDRSPFGDKPTGVGQHLHSGTKYQLDQRAAPTGERNQQLRPERTSTPPKAPTGLRPDRGRKLLGESTNCGRIPLQSNLEQSQSPDWPVNHRTDRWLGQTGKVDDIGRLACIGAAGVLPATPVQAPPPCRPVGRDGWPQPSACVPPFGRRVEPARLTFPPARPANTKRRHGRRTPKARCARRITSRNRESELKLARMRGFQPARRSRHNRSCKWHKQAGSLRSQ